MLRLCRGKIDWATAELLAFSSLASEGIQVRLSGEDSERGTFAQRHAVWHHAETGEEHKCLPALVEVANSPLSELGVVGFEFGWSICSPNSLVLWEAQFGDFSNEAQMIFDTLISSSESKWGVESGMVFLLPHGFDGMGPDHSTARPERWLQLFSSSKDALKNVGGDPHGIYKACNFVVASPTEPANYFHLLRRQMLWPFRRPLIVLAPKRTLRNPAATSPITDILKEEEGNQQSQFSCVADDPFWRARDKESVKGVLICSGELYFDLLKIRDLGTGLSNIAFVRLEQLAPFPSSQLNTAIESYPNLEHLCYAQEDAANYGALSFVREHITQKELVPSLAGASLKWISRPESAAPAIGHPEKHAESQKKLLQDVLDWADDT